MEDFELFPDEEEEAEEEEGGTNRLFIFLVAGFGAVLLLGVCAFIAWAVFIYPSIQNTTAQNMGVAETAAAMAAETTETPAESGQETPTETAEPIDAAEPTGTPARRCRKVGVARRWAGGANTGMLAQAW